MIKNTKNKGFSFVELIIVVAILSIVMIMVSQFMMSTVNTYTRTNADNKVQANAQETYDKIANHIMMAQAVKISTTSIKTETITEERKISTGAILSNTISSGSSYVGNFEMVKDIDETCKYKDEELYIDNSTSLLKYKTATSNGYLFSLNSKSIVPFKGVNYATVNMNSATDTMKTVIKKATIDANALNILYEDNERYYVAKYCFVGPTGVGKQDGKLYLKIEPTTLLLADEYAGNDVQQLEYKKKKLLAVGKINTTDVIKDEYLLCSGVEKFTLITEGNNNAIGINIEFVNKNMTYKSKGMISIRNSNVLSRPDKK